MWNIKCEFLFLVMSVRLLYRSLFFIRLFTERPLAISRWRRGRQCCNISGQMFSNSGPVVNLFSFAEVQAHRIGEKTTKKKVKFLPQN